MINDPYKLPFSKSVEQQSMSYDSMKTRLKALLFKNHNGTRVYTGEIAPQFQEQGINMIEAIFSPYLERKGAQHTWDPGAPSYRCVPYK